MWTKYAERYSSLRPVNVRLLEAMRLDRPWLPEVYWAFLIQLGFGEAAGLMLYSCPMTLTELDLHYGPDDFVAFGDDMAGGFYGFTPGQRERVVLLESGESFVISIGQTFDEFILNF